MNGNDLGTVAQNIITTLGGPTGGEIVGAALLVTLLFVATGLVDKRHGLIVAVIGVLAWVSTWIVRTAIGWA